MKSNKGYMFSSLLTQMIILPIVLTLGLFFIPTSLRLVLNTSSLTSSGNYTVKFIITLITFFSSLLVGGVVGFVFSKLSKNTPDSAKVRYLPSMIPIIYTLIFAVLALIFSKGNYNSGWWGIYTLKNPLFLIFNFALFFSGYHFIVPVVELISYTGFTFGILLYDRISKTTINNRTSKSIKVAFASLCITTIVFTGICTKDVINNGIIELLYGRSTVGNDLTEFDLMKIAPFKENNGLAKLDKKASLEFTNIDEMPRLDGATAAYPVYGAFVEAVYKGLGDYYEANKNSTEKDIFSAFVASDGYPLNIVKCSKTSEAYRRLINKEADIIFVAGPSKAQLEEIKSKGDEFVLTPIGFEAFVLFTNIKNPVDNLTINQIQDIYSGKITNWKEVGGQNKSILPYQRPEDSGSQTTMQNKVMKDIKMLEPTKETYAGGMGDIISQVASYKNAKNSIGYSFMYYSSSMIKNNQIKYISIDGVKPTPDTARDKTYPFTVPVYAVTVKSNTNKNVNIFVDWILSEEGQSLIEKTGYIPVK